MNEPRTRTRASAAPADAAALSGRSAVVLVEACAALGLSAVIGADALSRSTHTSSQALFWLGLLVIFVPIVLRLLGPAAGRAERISHVVLLGLSLYLVKVVGNPFGFTFADELAHAPNANAMLRTHELYGTNSILPVTSYYPGLEAVAAALAAMTGLSAFGAGLVVIGAARVVMMLALYLLFETLSGSAVVAGVAAAIYAANSNFLFFDAQFSYESLALPLLGVILFALARWRSSERPRAWSIVIGVLTLAVVMTHHLTAYALLAAIVALASTTFLLRRRVRYRNPWPFAAFAAAAILGWLAVVASSTVGYLSPALERAFVSTLHTIAGESSARAPFQAAGGAGAPLFEQIVAIASVLLMAIAFPFALRVLRHRYRRDPLVLLLTAAATAFFAVVLLRLSPAAWETANRASEFLFVGLAFALAYVALQLYARRPTTTVLIAIAAALAVVFAGGVISGWARPERVSQPYEVRAGSAVLRPEGREFAAWARTYLPQGAGAAASESDARLLATYAGARAIAGTRPDVRDLLQLPSYDPWQRELLRENDIRFVIVDRRERSFDNLAGYYFDVLPPVGRPDRLLPSRVALRFDAAGFDRIYDSGTLIAFDRERWLDHAPKR
jgi:hypothetical protein